MRIPVLDLNVERPTRSSLAWYGGLSAMTAAGFVDWPLAAFMVAGHLISENSQSQTVSGAAEGAESAAG